MTKKLIQLSTILKMKIHQRKARVHELTEKKYALSKQLLHTQERIELIFNTRKKNFLYRNNTEYYTSLLEHLQTLHASIYKQRNVCCTALQENRCALLRITNYRKIIEKIKSTKYSNTKR